MKKMTIIKSMVLAFAGIMLMASAEAQVENPVHWSYGLKKLPDNQYEVHLLARIDTGWHIYAQKQLPDAVAVPTKISFSPIPGLKLIGYPLEKGKKDIYTIKEAGVTNYEYAGKVDFVQLVRLKPGIKEIKGTITYQTCTHLKCLQEQTINFTVPVKQE